MFCTGSFLQGNPPFPEYGGANTRPVSAKPSADVLLENIPQQVANLMMRSPKAGRNGRGFHPSAGFGAGKAFGKELWCQGGWVLNKYHRYQGLFCWSCQADLRVV